MKDLRAAIIRILTIECKWLVELDCYAVDRTQAVADPLPVATGVLAVNDMPSRTDAQDENLPHSDKQEIDRIRSAFERQWRDGKRPNIEDYLRSVNVSLYASLLQQLVAVEVAARRSSGEGASIDQYHRRFPGYEAAVESGWARSAKEESPLEPNTIRVSADLDRDTGCPSGETNTAKGSAVSLQIGRYEIRRVLGEGSFGRVYLAYDPQLQRQVAIKVPDRKRLASDRAFLQEARVAAQLTHPGLVSVHDVQQGGGDVYIVQEYIDGQDLSGWVRANDPSPERIISLIKEVVEAVGFAHQNDLVHRDLKPANLLVDQQGHPHVADFGLALNESVQRLRKGGVCGTPAYMSPEQVRGLTHILDGRSDLWSIGVILYELLTGRRPFGGANAAEIFEEVKHRDPKPPRMIKPELPTELERICLKCLAKRQTDRYWSAADVLEDLEAWSAQSSTGAASEQPTRDVLRDISGSVTRSGPRPAESTSIPGAPKADEPQTPRIVPKGLRSFDEHDADFFLELLPGARDRDGLPESIRFWKLRIEETDPDKTFRVGLIYGPSGCGKSSLVKAGLLPRLASHAVAVYVEATPEDTEVRLLKGLRRKLTAIPDELALPDLLGGIREGLWLPEDQKVCLVVDQFEQWLHARQGAQDTLLVQALRHCDGGRLQCLALIRDDFWLATSRFMQELEIELLQGRNMALVDLFDPLHARKVLTEFGRAFGRLPAGALTQDQNSFLDRSVKGLAQDGKIICVRLALFADMLKGKPWNTATLSQVGGTEGLGVTFLDETFSAASAPAAHRHHQKAAQGVLKSLLPEAGTDIKGSRQPYDALLEASGYARQRGEFEELIRTLDSELRLITPTVPEGEDVGAAEQDASSAAHEKKSYQLTHDYLVRSLRDWLTRKQKETRCGRAELKLAERSALWSAKPENRHLPSVVEFANIRLLTRRKQWTEPQRKMMRQATRLRGIHTALVALCILLIAWGGFETYGLFQTRNVLNTDAVNLQDALKPLSPWQMLARARLESVLRREPRGQKERREQLHARIARQALTLDYDPKLLEKLCDTATPYSYIGSIREVLLPHQSKFIDSLWETLHDNTPGREKGRFRAGLALATYATTSDQWLPDDYHLLASELIAANPVHQPLLWEYLRPLATELTPDLEKLFADSQLSESVLLGAANALAEFLGNNDARIARLVAQATPAQYEILYPLLANSRDQAVTSTLSNLVGEEPAEEMSQAERMGLGRRRAGAAISLLRLGEVEKSFGAFQIRDDPESLTQFICRCRARDVKATELLDALLMATDMHSRFALLLALGDFALEEIPEARRDSFIQQLTVSYETDPSSGIHSATGWLMRQWGFDDAVTKVDHTPIPYDDTGQREWFVMEMSSGKRGILGLLGGGAKVYFTFIVFPPGEFMMGSPDGELDRGTNEDLHRVELTRPIAISDRETTWTQYNPFDGSANHHSWEQEFERKLTAEEPAFGADWFEAASYCRWLTFQAGMSAADQCYGDPESLPKDAEGDPEDWPVHLDRRGFRLPTEAEWEYICRSGTSTAFSFGNDYHVLEHYGWVVDNSEKWSHAVAQKRPNLRGIFDVHGNLDEWCHDWYRDYDTDATEERGDATRVPSRVVRGGCWDFSARSCRAASRDGGRPGLRLSSLGFRVAVVPSASHASQESGAELEGR